MIETNPLFDVNWKLEISCVCEVCDDAIVVLIDLCIDNATVRISNVYSFSQAGQGTRISI